MKTHSKFDYDLWTTEENGKTKYWTRVKATGEESEVNEEIFRFMNSEEKRIRRHISTTISAVGTIYSLDVTDEDGLALLEKIGSAENIEHSYEMQSLLQTFKSSLSANQLIFFTEVYENGQSIPEYAITHGIASATAYRTNDKISKKAKKFGLGG